MDEKAIEKICELQCTITGLEYAVLVAMLTVRGIFEDGELPKLPLYNIPDYAQGFINNIYNDAKKAKEMITEYKNQKQ